MRMERKYLAHYLDANFGEGSKNYVRLGKDLEAYQEELNPQVEVRRNILGEQNVIHNGYQIQSSAEPFYADQEDALFEPIAAIANDRKTGDGCQTTRVEVLVDSEGNQVWAYQEDCWVVPNSVGGDTSGVQLPFTVYNAGNRVPGVWTVGANTFTASSITLSKTTSTLAAGANETLTATKSPNGGTVHWSSSNTSAATVNSSGKVTAVAQGTAIITAEYYGAYATCVYTITAGQ